MTRRRLVEAEIRAKTPKGEPFEPDSADKGVSTGASSSAIDDLRLPSSDHSARLARVTDALNHVIERAERELADLKLGVSASIVLEEWDDGPSTICRLLTFRKHHDRWRLIVESGLDGDSESLSESPLVNTSRETRVLASKRLPELVVEMHRVAEEQIADVEQTVSRLEAYLASLSERRTR